MVLKQVTELTIYPLSSIQHASSESSSRVKMEFIYENKKYIFNFKLHVHNKYSFFLNNNSMQTIFCNFYFYFFFQVFHTTGSLGTWKLPKVSYYIWWETKLSSVGEMDKFFFHKLIIYNTLNYFFHDLKYPVGLICYTKLTIYGW